MRLQEIVAGYGKTLVAFSGGIDSALVLRVAADVLGREAVRAVTAVSPSIPASELQEAQAFATDLGVDHVLLETRELEDPNYAANPTTRCYFCKTELYTEMARLRGACGFETIANGTHADDLGDFRPGLQAAAEHGVKSPLLEAGFGKAEVRELAQELSIPIWDKPQAACLSSRIPHGSPVTREKLAQIEGAEDFLKARGYRVLRVRHLGERARLEFGPEELGRLARDPAEKRALGAALARFGFSTVTLDRGGYRTGSLNRPDLRPDEEVLFSNA